MKKRILFLLLSFCLTVWLFPVTAEAATEITWSEILTQIGDGTLPVTADGWRYETWGRNPNGSIVVGAIAVSGEDTINYRIRVENAGVINGGTFKGVVVNQGSITGGTFKGTVTNEGSITGGTFSTQPTGSGTVEGITVESTEAAGTQTESGGSTEAAGTQTESGGSTEAAGTETESGGSTEAAGTENRREEDVNAYFRGVIGNVMQEIGAVEANGVITIEDPYLRCLSDEMVEALLARPDVTAIIRFTDKGVDYELTIPAGKAPTDGQEWYGYYYLGSLYGWTSIESSGDNM
ncbi:MAG: hypothetical protein IJP31_01395 [Lachnospiraceae bacterium]|nr:hypothetical protein [Lachnospiraceae bacterium]